MKTREEVQQRLKNVNASLAHFADLRGTPELTQEQQMAFQLAEQTLISGAAALRWVLSDNEPDERNTVEYINMLRNV